VVANVMKLLTRGGEASALPLIQAGPRQVDLVQHIPEIMSLHSVSAIA
jgi:hypothetical protein